MKKFTIIIAIVLIKTISVAQIGAMQFIKTIKSGSWSDSAIWSTKTVPTANDKVFIVDSNQVAIDINNISCNGISIDGSSMLFAYSGGTINVSGDWDNNGIFDYNSSIVNLNGSGGQIISGKGTTFNNLNINTPDYISLWGSVSIKNELNITAGKFVTNGMSLVLISDQSGTARIAPINTAQASLSGNITVQRYINNSKTGWRLLGSAVVGDSVNSLSDNFTTYGFVGATVPVHAFSSIQYYNESVVGPANLGYVDITNANQILNNGTGYKCWIDSGIYNVDVTGQAAVGDQNFNITNTPSPNQGDDGWNLIANPYPSSIDWNSNGWTKAGINDAIYVWNPDLQQYACYMHGLRTNSASNIIPSSQSFWVQASGSNPVLNCTENVKVADNGKFMKTVNPTKEVNTITFGLSGANYSDETILNFTADALPGYDKKEDVIKLFSLNTKVPNISSITEKYDLSINSLPITMANQKIPIRVKVGVPGTYSIKSIVNMFFKQFSSMILEDLVTKTKIDITLTELYSFNISDTTNSPRFVLHLANPVKTPPATLKSFVTEPTCSYKANARAIVKPTKSGSWNYTWRAVNGNTIAVHNNVFGADTLNNLAVGQYTVTATENNIQHGVKNLTLTETIYINANPIKINATINHNDAGNLTAGSIQAEVVKGGNAPYKFHWSNNEVSTNIKNLSSGTYTLYTIDAKGCVDTSYHVVNADPLTLANSEERKVQNTPRNSDSNGKIKFTVFPNPNKGEFTVDITGLENSHEVRIILRDDQGTSVYESSFNVQDESTIQRKIVPDTKLNNGMYFCTLMVEGISHTVKVVVN